MPSNQLLPPDAFDALPRVGACEIHLATDFQNMVYEHAQFPADLKAEMYAWIRENALEERKPKDTEEQFIYKARKKAIGPFKKRMWSIEANHRRAIGQSLEERFTFLMKQLKIGNTAPTVATHAVKTTGGRTLAPRASNSCRRSALKSGSCARRCWWVIISSSVRTPASGRLYRA